MLFVVVVLEWRLNGIKCSLSIETKQNAFQSEKQSGEYLIFISVL